MFLTPSATICMSSRIFCSDSPRPRRSPTVRFRLRSPVHVSTRSPIPARPERVMGLAPRRTASRAVSARPRVIRAARVLEPKPSPSATPAASAMMFFHRAANLDSDEIFGRVHTEVPGMIEDLLHGLADILSPRGNGDRGRHACRHLTREARTREGADSGGVALPHCLLEDSGHRQVGVVLDPLRRAHDIWRARRRGRSQRS